jgi:NADPH:quinone reductase-like Zn-dependent oxidoreductase/DNA-binding transcriptional regulator YbjK
VSDSAYDGTHFDRQRENLVRKGKPNDPERRARILSATLEVIGSEGVHAASYRRIAAQAGVPLGSMTYYFPDLDGLIVAAFETLQSELEPRFAAPLRIASTPDATVEALVSATVGATSPSIADVRLYNELYHYAARSTRAADLVRAVQEESLALLRGRLPDSAARAVDALMWGWWSYRLFHEDLPLDQSMVRRAYRALLDVPPTVTHHSRRPTVPETMRAIRLTGPITPNELTVSQVPIPDVERGQVRIRVMAFGVNESEVTSRKGESGPDFTFPRILGIEAVGVVDAAGEGVHLVPGQKVATMMGGLGRSIDGSYAEYTVVDAVNVIPFDTDLPWGVVGALPEMLQTAHGSITAGLHLQAGQHVLIRGGTSTVGLTAIALAHQLGATVIATTRNPGRFDLLKQVGADQTLLDDDTLPDAVRGLAPDGLDAALEFVSATALPVTLSLVHPGGTVCFVGALNGEWTIPDFSPFTIPTGVRLTSYAGDADYLPAGALAQYLRAIEAGSLDIVVAGTYAGLDKVAEAQHDLESGHRPGKRVVLLAKA